MKLRVRIASVFPLLARPATVGCAALIALTAFLAGAFAQDNAVPPADLARLTDDTPLATDGPELAAFNRVVRLARTSSPDALASAVTPGVTARQLYEDERAQHRGKVVRVTGQLKRLKKVPANAELKKDGLVELYEGWVEEPFSFDKPTCVLFTDAPKDIAPADEIKDTFVILDGYSFKRVKDPVRGLAPLVIGRAIIKQDTVGDTAARALTDPRCDCPKEWLEHIEDDIRPQNAKENLNENLAYNYFVLRARQVSPELMAKHANHDLTFRRLFDAGRAKYRGEIVHVQGRLKRLNAIGPTPEMELEGIKELYEAWIFPAEYMGNPTCVILTELPPGLGPTRDVPNKWAPYQDMRDNTWTSFDGYFFKRYKYKAEDATRLAPLLLGRTLTVISPQTGNRERETAFSAYTKYFFPTAIVLALGLVGGVFFLSRWFRSGDRRVRDRVLSRTAAEFVEPEPEPLAAPPPPKED